MTLKNSIIVLNILTHSWFLIFEMFLWKTALAKKTFKMNDDLANDSAVLAKNQGLYNGFLAAGLIWSLISNDVQLTQQLQFFFLSCIGIAGIFGAITARTWMIFFIQALPAFIGLGLLASL